MNSIESQRNLEPTPGNELADTLELLFLDLTEGYNTQAMYRTRTESVQDGSTFLHQMMQDGLSAIHRYRVRTGTRRVRPAAAIVRD
jgi:hypothetical protein